MTEKKINVLSLSSKENKEELQMRVSGNPKRDLPLRVELKLTGIPGLEDCYFRDLESFNPQEKQKIESWLWARLRY